MQTIRDNLKKRRYLIVRKRRTGVVRTVRPQLLGLMRKGAQSRVRLAVVIGSGRCRIDATRTDSVFVVPASADSSATAVSPAIGGYRGLVPGIQAAFVRILSSNFTTLNFSSLSFMSNM